MPPKGLPVSCLAGAWAVGEDPPDCRKGEPGFHPGISPELRSAVSDDLGPMLQS